MWIRLSAIVGFAVCSMSVLSVRADEAPAAAAIEFFEKKVRPLLVEHCFECHGAKKQRGGFRLDSRETLLNPDYSQLFSVRLLDGV